MNKKILIITRTQSGMRLQDPEIIAKKYSVKMFVYSDHRRGNKWFHYLLVECQVIVWLLKNILRSDLIYVLFNDVHAFFPVILGRLTGKKVLIHMGGYDGAWVPSLNYGVFDNPLRKWIVLLNARFCHKLVPISQYLIHGSENHYGQRKVIAGLTRFISLPPEKYRVIHPATPIPAPESVERDLKNKENAMLLVAKIDGPKTYAIKSIGFYLDVAKAMGKYHFYLIGANEEVVRKIYNAELPQNLTLIPFIPLEQIKSYYRLAKVIFVPSVTEGGPLVILEGMAHGCIPIGTPQSAIPEMIGNTGKLLERMDIKEAVRAIEWAMQEGDGRAAYEKCRTNFSLQRREKELISLFEDMFHS